MGKSLASSRFSYIAPLRSVEMYEILKIYCPAIIKGSFIEFLFLTPDASFGYNYYEVLCNEKEETHYMDHSVCDGSGNDAADFTCAGE